MNIDSVSWLWSCKNACIVANESLLFGGPAVLNVQEVRSLLAQVKTFSNYAYLSTCSLRLHEGLHLEVSDSPLGQHT
jgi:hypothetical protein